MSDITLFTPSYRHELSTDEVEYLMRENMNIPTAWKDFDPEVIASLRDKKYFDANGLSDKSADFYAAYKKMDWQEAVFLWSKVVFGIEAVNDKRERAYRFGEESLELLQSCDITEEDLHKLVRYVYNRPKGDFKQEVGGVMTTLSVLASVHNTHVVDATFTEIKRIWNRIDQIREKQKNKPGASPLQGKPDSEVETLTREERIFRVSEAVVALVEERTFIKGTEIIPLIADQWHGIPDFDIVKHLDFLVRGGVIKALDIIHSDTRDRIRTVYYPAKVQINSFLGAE